MSLEEYEAFFFGACHADGEAPEEHWRSVAGEPRAARRRARAVRELRILGPGHGSPLGVEGRTWLAADGTHNLPDGEVFTSPRRDRDGGRDPLHVPRGLRWATRSRTFACASRAAASSRRRPRAAPSTCARCSTSTRAPRILGEIAFGLNYEIDRFTRNILFDEKIGGTMHLALGAGSPRRAGRTPPGCTGI